jgi:hypothetical protein
MLPAATLWRSIRSANFTLAPLIAVMVFNAFRKNSFQVFIGTRQSAALPGISDKVE